MHERHFQLQPLIDMDPYAVHGRLNSSVDMLSRDLVKIKGVVNDLVQVMPLSSSEVNGPKTLVPVHSHQKSTLVMGIVNATPDSFSDGGKFESFGEAVSHTMKLFSDGAEIVDIGGQSTRVGADSVDAAEELSRVIPVVAGVRSMSKDLATKPIISVDTFVARVAQEALDAGADIINDVSGGDLDEEMFKVVAEYGCPQRNDKPAFAQFHEQLFVSLLGFPVLVGSSRKGFIGQVTGKKVASDRVFGTAATVTSAIQGNASIVRVHDVDSMVDVAKVSDRIYRN
ncbi:Dihydropteroate synthase [Smittium culicis]|uniref:Dihydropteroate synthase n=1 Tax=Smittium culicis TaxID=133412 RepID=A0A1R1YQ97_9FUNG|nr:Dihydropteroate synthase [Smittium culicis]